jgi:DNA-binding response OmpR family regulator
MNETTVKRILIVDDDDTYLGMIKLRLELEGYRVDALTDAVAGFERIRQVKPDLVVLDLRLPEAVPFVEGEEARLDRSCGHKICRMIKFDRNLKSIPVLILTCSDSPDDISLATRAGADAFLNKTSGADALISVIREMIRKQDLTFTAA